MEFKFDKGIKPPQKTGRNKYGFRFMEINDSFFISPEDIKRTRIAASVFKSRHPGWNYVIDPVTRGYRLWRIS